MSVVASAGNVLSQVFQHIFQLSTDIPPFVGAIVSLKTITRAFGLFPYFNLLVWSTKHDTVNKSPFFVLFTFPKTTPEIVTFRHILVNYVASCA